MNDVLPLASAFSTGALLGLFFFGALWWTVHSSVVSERPALWFMGSLLLRISVVLGGFWFISQGHWSRLVAGLLGLLIARVVIVKQLARGSAKEPIHLENEASIAH